MLELGLDFFTAIGGLTAIYTVYAGARKLMTSRRGELSWKEVDNALGDLVEKIKANGYKPDMILGIGKGGAILSGLLSHRLDYIPVFHVDRRIRHRSDTGLPDGEDLVFCGDVPAYGKSLLIVNGESNSGSTILSVVEGARQYGPSSIKTAALFGLSLTNSNKINVTYSPDFIGKMVDVKKVPPWKLMKNHGD